MVLSTSGGSGSAGAIPRVQCIACWLSDGRAVVESDRVLSAHCTVVNKTLSRSNDVVGSIKDNWFDDIKQWSGGGGHAD